MQPGKRALAIGLYKSMQPFRTFTAEEATAAGTVAVSSTYKSLLGDWQASIPFVRAILLISSIL